MLAGLILSALAMSATVGPWFDDGGDRRGFARRFDWADRYRSPGPGGRHAERPNDRGERRSAGPLPAGLDPGTEFRSEYKIPGTRRQGCPNARAALRGARPSPR